MTKVGTRVGANLNTKKQQELADYRSDWFKINELIEQAENKEVRVCLYNLRRLINGELSRLEK